MTSFILKITTLALIFSIGLAGINIQAVDPRYDNQAIAKDWVCDHTAPTSYVPAYKDSFNCTDLIALQNGSYVCNANPCQFYQTIGPYLECSWQSLGTPKFIVDGKTTVNLFPCYKCATPDCTGRYYYDNIVCDYGKMITKDYGVTWTCSDETCKGQMKMQPDGTYACIDSTCAGTMIFTNFKWTCQEATCLSPASMTYTNNRWQCSDNRCSQAMVKTGSGWACSDSSCPIPMVLRGDEWVCLTQSSLVSSVFPWVVVVLLAAAVGFQAFQARNQKKPAERSFIN